MSYVIPFSMQREQQSMWAWAAAAASIANYYDPAREMTQCSLANWATGQTNCCVNGSSKACNREAPMNKALDYCGILNKLSAGALTFEEIKMELDNQRPVCMTFTWPGSGGAKHPLVIIGYQDGEDVSRPTLVISDPSTIGITVLDYANFPYNFMILASWTDSYTTHP
jgi:hypothetical protein